MDEIKIYLIEVEATKCYIAALDPVSAIQYYFNPFLVVNEIDINFNVMEKGIKFRELTKEEAHSPIKWVKNLDKPNKVYSLMDILKGTVKTTALPTWIFTRGYDL